MLPYLVVRLISTRAPLISIRVSANCQAILLGEKHIWHQRSPKTLNRKNLLSCKASGLIAIDMCIMMRHDHKMASGILFETSYPVVRGWVCVLIAVALPRTGNWWIPGHYIVEILNSIAATTVIPMIDIYLLMFVIDLLSLTMDRLSVGMVSWT